MGQRDEGGGVATRSAPEAQTQQGRRRRDRALAQVARETAVAVSKEDTNPLGGQGGGADVRTAAGQQASTPTPAGILDSVFDLGAWVTGQFAEAGRKKLTKLVLGTEQERALDSAARKAIKLTAQEIYPDDRDRAEDLERVIDQVFSEPVSDDAAIEPTTMLAALEAGVSAQLAVLDDETLTGQQLSSADVLGVPGTVLAGKLFRNLWREIGTRAARGGPLAPLADQLNHDVTHKRLEQTYDSLLKVSAAVQDALERSDVIAHAALPRSGTAAADMALHVRQLLEGLQLGDHEEAERRVNHLFLPWLRNQQRAAVESLVQLASTSQDHETQLVACTLVEAADRLDPDLVAVDEVEQLARSEDDTLRSSAATLLWQWATVVPGRVPVPLLARLTLPSSEDWYVHAPARAGAKQLLLARSAARAVFDRMAASRDREDRDYAVCDLLEVAEVEPRVVPRDLVHTLARDRDKDVAARGAKLLRAMTTVKEVRPHLYGQFGL